MIKFFRKPIFNPSIPEIDPQLSRAELQMLQRIVAKVINKEEQMKEYALDNTSDTPSCDLLGDTYWFNKAGRHSQKIKKLAQLQYRLKHKIKTRG